MGKQIYKSSVSYFGVLNDEHNENYLKIINGVIDELSRGLNLSWIYSHDPNRFKNEEELAEAIAQYPWYMKTLVAEGEPDSFVIFTDDEYSVNLEGASGEWILLVNAILRELEEYNLDQFGDDSLGLDELNG